MYISIFCTFIISALCAASEYDITCAVAPATLCGTNGAYTFVNKGDGTTKTNGDFICATNGDTIKFNVPADIPAHPFDITSLDGSTSLLPNLLVNAQDTYTFTCDLATLPLKYSCTIHPRMTGMFLGPATPTNPVAAPVAPVSASDSICNRYSAALKINNLQLVTTVVNGTINAVVADPILLPFFNGNQPPGSTNFLANGAALNGLSGGLITFFGAALGCTDNTIGAYTGATMFEAHQGRGIGDREFNQFNSLLLGVTAGAGVTAADNAAILGVLESQRSAIADLPQPDPAFRSPAEVKSGYIVLIIFLAVVAALGAAILMFAMTLFLNPQDPDPDRY